MPRQQNKGEAGFNVRVDIGVPGSEIVVNRDQHEDVYVALRDAFDAARRQLEDHGRRLRRETKTHPQEYTGLVARLVPEEGFGFIRRADGNELYFSFDNLVNTTFDQIKEGDEVKFIEEMAAEGPQAKRVSVGQHHIPL